jgi:hypothetical protein
MTNSDFISAGALVLSILSFCGQCWHLWRDRPRLVIFVVGDKIYFPKKPNNEPVDLCCIKVCNIGFRPIAYNTICRYWP